jgi:Ulp1 family protease
MTTFDPANPPQTPTHRRTVSAATPTRSSRRAKINTTYAADSHREFIRELRELLGQKALKKDQEEREIDLQIARLRAEEKAVEGTLAGKLARLPELLGRKVHEALYDTPEDDVVIQNSFGKISGRDIHRLRRTEWLNDELINYYFAMIRQRSTNPESVLSSKLRVPRKPLPRTYALSSFFFEIWAKRGYDGVRRWTKRAKINVFDMDRIIVPINKGGFHWVLGVVNVQEKRIEYYDSMGREGENADNRHYLTIMREFMVLEAKGQGREYESIKNWPFYVPVPSPPQTPRFPRNLCFGFGLTGRNRRNNRTDGIAGCLPVRPQNV